MRLYFNPHCSKSRAARALLENAGYKPEIVDYQAAPLNESELSHLLDALNDAPSTLVRTGDSDSAAPTEDRPPLGRDRIIAILRQAPERMQRPVLLREGRAIIARPAERIFELIASSNADEATS